jgi:hypothetical protein
MDFLNIYKKRNNTKQKKKEEIVGIKLPVGTLKRSTKTDKIKRMSKPLRETVEEEKRLEEQRLLQNYAILTQPLNGIITMLGHGGKNTDYLKTTTENIPYNMIVIYALCTLGFSTFNRTRSDSEFHRMHQLIVLSSLFKTYNNSCDISAKDYFLNMTNDPSIKKAEDYLRRSMYKTYDKETLQKQIENTNRLFESIGSYRFGKFLNQRYALCNRLLYNIEDIHDVFCGLFMHVCQKSESGGLIWISASDKGITFIQPPETFNFSELQTYSPTLHSGLNKELVYDLSSFKDIIKIQNFVIQTHFYFIFRLLIARKVDFSVRKKTPPSSASSSPPSSASSSPPSSASSPPPSSNDFYLERYGMSFINDARIPYRDYDSYLEYYVNEEIEFNTIKIFNINVEDFNILLYILWFISNNHIEPIDGIKFLMNIMWKSYVLAPDEYSKNACIILFNKRINDYVQEWVNHYNVKFLTIMNACRPNADPIQNQTVMNSSSISQEQQEVCDLSSSSSSCIVPLPPIPPPINPITFYPPPPPPTPYPTFIGIITPIIKKVFNLFYSNNDVDDNFMLTALSHMNVDAKYSETYIHNLDIINTDISVISVNVSSAENSNTFTDSGGWDERFVRYVNGSNFVMHPARATATATASEPFGRGGGGLFNTIRKYHKRPKSHKRSRPYKIKTHKRHNSTRKSHKRHNTKRRISN